MEEDYGLKWISNVIIVLTVVKCVKMDAVAVNLMILIYIVIVVVATKKVVAIVKNVIIVMDLTFV